MRRVGPHGGGYPEGSNNHPSFDDLEQRDLLGLGNSYDGAGDSQSPSSPRTAKSATLCANPIVISCFVVSCLGTAMYLSLPDSEGSSSSSLSFSLSSLSAEMPASMAFNVVPTAIAKKDPLTQMAKFRGTKQDSVRSGKQTVEKGCANIYGSDPNKEWVDDRPGSSTFGQKLPVPSFTICGDTKVDGDELMALGFDRKGVEQPDMVGVTYVETGEGCWLTLYDNSNFDGDSTIIAPMTAAPLVKVGEHAWDDVTRSLTASIKPQLAGDTAIALFMPGGTALGDMNPHCVGLLEDSPKRNPGATGFYLCGDVTKANKWTFTQNDIIKAGYGIPADGGDHIEVDYIMTGAAVKLKVYDGNSADSWFQDALKMGESDELDLKNSEYVKNDEKETWADVVKSFVMYTSESDETTLFAADWNKDYKK